MSNPVRILATSTRIVLGLAISAAFVVATASQVRVDLLGDAWSGVHVGLVVTASLVSVIEVSLRALRWRVLLMPIADIRAGEALGFLSIGHLANAVLPMRLGDVARAVAAGTRWRISRTSVLGTIAVERLADTALLGIAVTAGVVIGFSQFGQSISVLLVVGSVAVLLSVILIGVLSHRSVAASRLGGILRYYGKRFLAGAASLRQPRPAFAVLILTATSFLGAIAIFALAAAAAGLSVPVWKAALVIAAVTLSTAIPSGPASIGTYEFVGMSVMTSMGYPPEQSLLAVALVHVAATVPAASMGVIAIWILGLKPRISEITAMDRDALRHRAA